MEHDLVEPDVGTDEVAELFGAYLTETFEARYLRLRSEVVDGLLTLVFGVAVLRHKVLREAKVAWSPAIAEGSAVVGILAGSQLCFDGIELGFAYLCLPATDAEERCLQDEDVPLLDEFGKELEEEGEHQEADVHTVVIGIGGHDDLVVAKAVQSVLDVEGSLQEVELLVLIDHLLGELVAVEGLASE